MPARAVRIVELDYQRDIYLFHEKKLKKILLAPNVANKKVACLSVAGPFRKGKSFLLNIFLRYLTAHCSGVPPVGSSWLKEEDCFDGFTWRGGKERDTNGILLWNRPFFLKGRNGEEFALFLMDTQGVFDHNTTVKGCALIFGLSTMISSLQIYNLTRQIEESDLHTLQLFTDYGKLALDESDITPFQSLMFLIRDWDFEDEYGSEGGQNYLSEVLKESSDKPPELGLVRHEIKNSFSSVKCFLLPNPGRKVARCVGKEMRGTLPDVLEMTPEFHTHVCDLTRLVFGHIPVKEVNGAQICGGEMFQHFKEYMKVFTSAEIPSPKSLLVATAEANHHAAMEKAFVLYDMTMTRKFNGRSSVPNLFGLHTKAQSEAAQQFECTRKMGGESFSAAYLQKLMKKIATSYTKMDQTNKILAKKEVREAELLRQQKELQRQLLKAQQKQREAEERAEQEERHRKRAEKKREKLNKRLEEKERLEEEERIKQDERLREEERLEEEERIKQDERKRMEQRRLTLEHLDQLEQRRQQMSTSSTYPQQNADWISYINCDDDCYDDDDDVPTIGFSPSATTSYESPTQRTPADEQRRLKHNEASLAYYYRKKEEREQLQQQVDDYAQKAEETRLRHNASSRAYYWRKKAEREADEEEDSD